MPQETVSQLTFVSISAFLNFHIFSFCPFDHAERQYSESENKTGKCLHCFMPLYSFTVASLSVSDDGLAVKLFQILKHIYRFQFRMYAHISLPYNIITNSIKSWCQEERSASLALKSLIYLLSVRQVNIENWDEMSYESDDQFKCFHMFPVSI